jgi:hydrogenase-4 component D
MESVAGFAWFLHVVHKVIFGPVSVAAEVAQDPPATMAIPLLAFMGLILVSPIFSLPIIDRLAAGLGR